MSATQPFVEGLLSSLKEAPGRLDAERLKQASVLAAESVVRYYGCGGEESFQWLQHIAAEPFCQHMSFIYKSLAVSIYIAPVHGDTIYVSREEMDLDEQFRKDNNLTTALLPVSLDTLEPLKDGLLLNPDTLEPLNLEKLNEENEVYMMSPWEVHAMACFDVGNYLDRKGYRIYQSNNLPDLYPQLIAGAPDGSIVYIIIHSVAVGNKDSEKTIDVRINSALKDYEGFFINRVYGNWINTGEFNEVELLRQGGHCSNEIELVPLSQVESVYPNIHLNITYFDTEE
jgi:hypothetical protein